MPIIDDLKSHLFTSSDQIKVLVLSYTCTRVTDMQVRHTVHIPLTKLMRQYFTADTADFTDE